MIDEALYNPFTPEALYNPFTPVAISKLLEIIGKSTYILACTIQEDIIVCAGSRNA